MPLINDYFHIGDQKFRVKRRGSLYVIGGKEYTRQDLINIGKKQ